GRNMRREGMLDGKGGKGFHLPEQGGDTLGAHRRGAPARRSGKGEGEGEGQRATPGGRECGQPAVRAAPVAAAPSASGGARRLLRSTLRRRRRARERRSEREVQGARDTLKPLPIRDDDGDGEAVPSLAADGLDRRGTDARLGGEQLVQAARALDARIVTPGV